MTNSAKTIIRALFFTLLACAAVTPSVVAQDATSKKVADSEDSTPKDEHSKARRDLMVQALEKYSVILDGNADQPATLDSSTLLRLLPTHSEMLRMVCCPSIQQAPANVPAALANMYVHGALLNGLAMQCFADVHQGKVEVIRAERSVWSPGTRYSKFAALPDAPDPSDNPRTSTESD